MKIRKSIKIKVIVKIAISVIAIFILTYCGENRMSDNNCEIFAENNFAQDIITLHKGDIELKILPKIGGRIVSLKKEDSNNILKSDSSLWHYRFSEPLPDRIYPSIIPFNGHTVWLGAQTEWWKYQDEKPEMKDKGWPPDPYLIYGNYTITKLMKSAIDLVSMPSPYTGVQLFKHCAILNDGRIIVKAEAKNVRTEPISWDVWMNTRVDGYAKVYVPVSSDKDVRMQFKFEDKFEKMPYEIKDGFFTFKTIPPSEDVPKRHGKAMIYPKTNKAFAFTGDKMFVIKFKKYPREKVHPAHGLFEVYNSVDDKGDALMELEYHSPYSTFKPGEKISAKEVWEVVNYRNGEGFENHVEFIKTYLKLSHNK